MTNITAKELFNIFLKNILIIIISAVICASGAYIYCKNFTDARYQSQGDILVTNGGISSTDGANTESENTGTESTDSTTSDDSTVGNTDVVASINLLPTIRSILSGTGIYKGFAAYLEENSDYTYNYKTLMGASNFTQSDERALFFTISFELGSKKDAIEITNHFLRFAPTYIEDKIFGCRVEADPECDSAVQTAPRTLSTTFTAGVLGIILSYAVVFLITILNSTIQTDEDFSARYNIPVIGNIPDFSISHNNTKPYSKKNTGGKDNG